MSATKALVFSLFSAGITLCRFISKYDFEFQYLLWAVN